MFDLQKIKYNQNRREFLNTTTKGIGVMALASLMFPDLALGKTKKPSDANFIDQGGVLNGFHHLPKAKRIIYIYP